MLEGILKAAKQAEVENRDIEPLSEHDRVVLHECRAMWASREIVNHYLSDVWDHYVGRDAETMHSEHVEEIVSDAVDRILMELRAMIIKDYPSRKDDDEFINEGVAEASKM